MSNETRISVDNETVSEPSSSVECARLKHLRNALDKTIDKCIEAGKIQLFARCFPKLDAQNPNAVKGLHSQYISQLKRFTKEEMDTMFEEEKLLELMDEFEQLVNESKESDNTQSWRPSGDPLTDTSPLMTSVKLKQKEKLELILQHLEEENREMERIVVQKRNNLFKTSQQIQQTVDNMEEQVNNAQIAEIEEILKNHIS